MTKHATTMNGDSHGHTLNADPQAEREEIVGALTRMDGRRFFAFSVWSFPDDVHFDDLDIEEASSFYLQCAGAADAMTVELREPAGDEARHYVIGKAPVTGTASVEIEFDEYAVDVHPEEVFTAAEAGEVFLAYMDTGTVPDRWHRREITERG